jgi:UV DNA damage endonuclease
MIDPRKIGYACINMELGATGLTVNRDAKKVTFEKPNGMDIVSTRALSNIKNLKTFIEWNNQHNIGFYRMSSGMFPWWTHYKLESLKDWSEIKELLAEIGQIARQGKQRLTFHPSHFVVLGSLNPNTRQKGRIELERHSEVLDYMGYKPSHYNKLNIHIGTAQNGKDDSMKRWIQSFQKLSENCRARVVVENDDKENMYSVKDLYHGIYEQVGVPITFDTLHHDVGAQSGLTATQAAQLAATTWTNGNFVIHHSSKKKVFEDSTSKMVAHADYIYEEIQDFGTGAWIMVEAKAKERAILEYIKNGPVNSKLILES